MTRTPTNNSPKRLELAPHQARFVEAFFKPGAAPYQLLAWPPGAGKTRAATHLIPRLVTSGGAAHVIVIAPKPLMNAWRHSVQSLMNQLPALVMNRRDFLELQGCVPVDQNPWPDGIIIISQDIAKRPDIAATIAEAAWDLLIVDEAHRIVRQLRQLVQSLIERRAAKRVLLLTATPPSEGFTDIIPELATTHLALADIIGGEPGAECPLVMQPLIHYARNEDEVQLLRMLQAVANELPDDSKGQFVRRLVELRASSSPFAVEQTLFRVARRLEKGGREEGPVEESDSETETDWGEVPETTDPWGSVPDALSKITRLVDSVAGVRSDGKFTALEKLLDDLMSQSQDHRICVFTDFASTADYLLMSLEEDKGCFGIVGLMTSEARFEAINGFTNVGHILVATTAALQGFELAFADTVIHYDLPVSREGMVVRHSRVNRYGRTKPCSIYAFLDESKVLPLEAELLERHGWVLE